MADNPTWRVLPLSTHSAAQNMAIDQAVLEHIASGQSPPTIRFYQWNPSAVSIGYFQSLKREVRVDELSRRGFEVVRRQTGGGAVYHDAQGEITYSILAPDSFFPNGITQSYHEICGFLVNAFARIGIASEFKPINDIIVSGKKISGNAQTRRNGVLLQHGTILYDLDVETMFSVLRVSDEKISDKFIASVRERVTRVKDHAQVSREELYQALLAGFTEKKEWMLGELSETETRRADELAKTKYGAAEWNALR
ncbi:MAG: biotin/lipoate A/B protein ligase family protein [Candidatus Diapherotrites archaeon]|nr:biotin/lipoate A/B protein ligase family protein [Candidatus Diapherotrites archaeon]